jgi:hypothetical protein
MNLDILIEEKVFDQEVAGDKVVTFVKDLGYNTFREAHKWSTDDKLAHEVIRRLNRKGWVVEVSRRGDVYHTRIMHVVTKHKSFAMSIALAVAEFF